MTVVFARRTVLLLLSCASWSASPAPGVDADGPIAPRLDGVGQSSRTFAACSEEAQPFLNQGLDLAYAFNHGEARRAFQEAARLDPQCPMAPWGEALVLGPNINDPMPPERHAEAHAAAQKGLTLLAARTDELNGTLEAAWIETLATRYDADKNAERAPLDLDYAERMEALRATWPDDPDHLTLLASAWMNTMPWDYWLDEETPRPRTAEVVELLEHAIEIDPRHTGAHHYYIHIVEPSANPDRGIPSADVLGELAPSAGHLVHMPSHIYIRTGRYLDAAASNERAILADEDYVAQCQAQGIYPLAYYPHNIHFLWSAASFAGDEARAIPAADKVAEKIPVDQAGGVGFMQNYLATPVLARVRFARWQELLDLATPAAELVYTRGIHHYGRALAQISLGDRRAAKTELRALRRLARSKAAKRLSVGFGTSDQLLRIAGYVVEGELLRVRGRSERAMAAFQQAILVEDRLRYSEPPTWHQPTRHRLGDLLLAEGRYEAAARIFQRDLEEFRDNGWALSGLLAALRGLDEDTLEIEQRLDEAWSASHLRLTTASLR